MNHSEFGYTVAVTSKKGVIGIAVPSNRCDASRSSPADHAASLSVPPFMVARMGGRKARRFAQAVPGTATRSSHRPQLQLGAVVVANRTAWRPIMAKSPSLGASAQIITHARFNRPPVMQHPRRGPLPKVIVRFWAAAAARRAAKNQQVQAEHRANAIKQSINDHDAICCIYRAELADLQAGMRSSGIVNV